MSWVIERNECGKYEVTYRLFGFIPTGIALLDWMTGDAEEFDSAAEAKDVYRRISHSRQIVEKL